MNGEIKRGPGRPRKIEATEGAAFGPSLSTSGDAVTVRLHYDVWETEDIRHYAGSTVALPADIAEKLLSIGKASLPKGDA
jgi:hypothetical protein